MSAIPIVLGVAALLSIPIICGYVLYKSFSTGQMPARGASYSRADSPIWFWVCATMYAALPIFELFLIGPIAWQTTTGR
jgi:hypothetical protein